MDNNHRKRFCADSNYCCLLLGPNHINHVYLCAIFDICGNLLAQAEHIPVHLGSLPWGVKNILEYMRERGEQWQHEDIVIANDPYITGTHLNDVTLIKPIFFKKKLMGFSSNKAHHADVGGMSPGSISCDAKSLYEEGVVLPPLKLLKQGFMNKKVLNGFLKKVRTPDITSGDLRAQIAAVNLGEKRVGELVQKYGIDMLFDVFNNVIYFGEKRMKEKLKIIPDGIYKARDCLEEIAETDDLTWIYVTLTKEKDCLNIDFSGTHSQVKAPFNAVFGVTLSAACFAVE